jgi:hypothetical protein
MAGKQYEVIAPFDTVDKKTGKRVAYKVGDTYSGPNAEQYLVATNSRGPLVVEKTSPKPAPAADSGEK